MALVLANRVQETATPNTTVSFTLTGAVSGFQTFAVIGNTNTAYYSATDSAGNWEVGLGTYSTTGPTLTRTTVYASSNSGSAVTFSGTVNVFVTYPAEVSAYSSNNPGTSGNVLTSNGTGVAPSWQSAPAPACAAPCTPGIVYGVSITNGRVSLGYQAGQSFQGVNTVAVGQCAGRYCQASGSVSVGLSAGRTNQGGDNVAIGAYSGFLAQGYRAIAIGYQAGATLQPSNSIAIGAFVNATSSCQTHIGPIRSVGSCTGSYQALFYCGGTQEVIRGTAAGGVACATPSVAGKVYGRTQTCGAGGNVSLGQNTTTVTGNGNIAIGTNAGGGAGGSISIGYYAAGACNQGANAVAIGTCSRSPSANTIAIGNIAVAQSCNGIAIGYNAIANAACSIVIGANGFSCCAGVYISHVRNNACVGASAVGLGYCTTTKEILYGVGGGGGVCCATPTVAGKVYGKTEVNCTSQNTTLGFQSNAGGSNGTAIGFQASTFGSAGVAIGSGAYTCFGTTGAVAVGYQANSVANNGIAIGRGTSAGANGIAIGAFTTASSGGIVLNATGSAMPCVSPNRTYINPITYTPCSIGLNTLYYCGFTKEVFNGPAGGGGGVCCATPTVAGKVYGRTDTACVGNNTGLGNGINFGFANACTVLIGNSTTWNRFGGTCNVVIGAGANACCYAVGNVIVGKSAVVYCSTLNAVAVGKSAVANSYGVSIGVSALSGQNYNVAIGSSAFSASCSSIAIGRSASASFCMCFAPNAVAIGPFASTNGANTVAIGSSATTLGMAPFVSDGAIAIGNAASAGYQNAIAIGNGVTASGSNQTHIKPIRNAAGPFTLRYDPTTGEITYN